MPGTASAHPQAEKHPTKVRDLGTRYATVPTAGLARLRIVSPNLRLRDDVDRVVELGEVGNRQVEEAVRDAVRARRLGRLGVRHGARAPRVAELHEDLASRTAHAA